VAKGMVPTRSGRGGGCWTDRKRLARRGVDEEEFCAFAEGALSGGGAGAEWSVILLKSTNVPSLTPFIGFQRAVNGSRRGI